METSDLLASVIKAMQRNSQVRPTVYALLSSQEIEVPMLNFIGDGRQKAHLLFFAGRDAARSHTKQELISTVFVSEVWLTSPAGHKKEAVMLARSSNKEPYSTGITVYEIKRDKKKKPTELVSLGDETQDTGLMGVAFIAGWKSRHLSEQDVQKLQPQGMRAFLSL